MKRILKNKYIKCFWHYIYMNQKSFKHKNPSDNLNCLLFDEQLLFFLMKKKLKKNNVKNLITS